LSDKADTSSANSQHWLRRKVTTMVNLADERLAAWRQAVHLYASLASGQPPPQVVAADLPPGGGFYMDVPFRLSRYFSMDVTYEPGGMVAVGSPAVVAGAAIGRLIATSIGHMRAASASRPQWRGHHQARVVVTDSATWCGVVGRWLCFDHDSVGHYQLSDQPASILSFANLDPVRLLGSSAWCHAVLFAYLRYGAGAWQNAPFLYPIRQAALHAAVAS
jgi:hypothetical protein